MTQDKEKDKRSPLVPGRFVLVALLVVNLIGLAVSLELSKIHYSTHTNPDYQSICAINEKVNCETVARSPYSVFLGVPISGWGTIAYTFLALLTIVGLSRRRLHSLWPKGILFFAFCAAVLVSALLAYISYVIIDSLCLFCTTLYVVNIVQLVLSAVALRLGRINPFVALWADLKALASVPRLTAGVVIATISIVGLTIWLFPPYWHQIGWADLPVLQTGTDKSGAHWIGASSPLVTIYEYSDYECPYCRKAHKTMRDLVARHRDELRLVHKHMPIDMACNPDVKRVFHQRACEFSKAVECAGVQGMFWDMNDALFAIQDTVSPMRVDLGSMAVQLKLDRQAFNQCMETDVPMRAVLRELAEGTARGVMGTPTFFIGNQPYPGGIPEKAVLRYLERARKLEEH